MDAGTAVSGLSPARVRQVKAFRARLLRWFSRHRRQFPWRETTNPYRILISEVMLQQTQTDRVVRYYERFIKRFPTLSVLAKSSTRDVYRLWQGLGYNRRALALRSLAREVCRRFAGRIPALPEELEALPGIGPYTARAVCTFAFNAPQVLIETNIRTVFLHEFFARRRKVADWELLPLLEAALDRRNPRRWYYALMDYGAALKKEHRAINARSAHYRRQSPFKGSLREVRGRVLRQLAARKSWTMNSLCKAVAAPRERVVPALEALRREGFVSADALRWSD